MIVAKGRNPFPVSRAACQVAVLPMILVAFALVAVGPAHFYGHGDADLFRAVARNPFASGVDFPGDHLAQGVAYRYGHVGFPLCGWVLGLGQVRWITWSLAVAFVGSVGLWFATTAEVLRRAGRDPRLACLLMLSPFALVWAYSPIVVSEPLAIGLLLLAYLYAADDTPTGTVVFAALTILTRAAMAVAFLPLVWRAWREHGRRGLATWTFAATPYALWSTWVLIRVGHLPFLDPATTRRYAIAAPFAGWIETLRRPMDHGQGYGLLIGAITIVLAALVVTRSSIRTPLVQAALALCAFSIGYGWAVWEFPTEAVRVLAPAHAFLLLAALTRVSPARPASLGRDDDGVVAGRAVGWGRRLATVLARSGPVGRAHADVVLTCGRFPPVSPLAPGFLADRRRELGGLPGSLVDGDLDGGDAARRRPGHARDRHGTNGDGADRGGRRCVIPS